MTTTPETPDAPELFSRPNIDAALMETEFALAALGMGNHEGMLRIAKRHLQAAIKAIEPPQTN